MVGMLIAGTSSDAGKSLVVTGLCRAFKRRGIDVAPYKAQNMSNNSMVCADGAEIGRAQYLQALAAGVEPSSAMNPVLLKPGSDRRSFIVLRGQPGGVLESGQYATGRAHLAEAARAAYRELAERHELIVCEGAGSPAEINLRAGDYVNMGHARHFNLPVILVGDIDRGGVLAAIYGTWGLLEPDDRRLLAGYIINKFRGDDTILAPGLAELSARCGLAHLGTLPWLRGVWLDGEDTLTVGRWRAEGDAGDELKVAVIRLPRISNATDVDALAQEPGVTVQVTTDPRVVAAADLVVLPGSRSTLSDLAWLREQGLAEALESRGAQGAPVFAVCGGFQMLGHDIDDPVEGQGRARGLGLLPIDVAFHPEKIVARATSSWRGHPVSGYEIHHGVCTPHPGAEPFLDGVRAGNVWGTMLHGSLESDGFRRAFLADVAAASGAEWCPSADAPTMGERRERMIDTLADACERHLDLERLLELARLSASDHPAEAKESGENPEAVPPL